MFIPGELVKCKCITETHPHWKGKLPKINSYYLWKEYDRFFPESGFVEELFDEAYPHPSDWYESVNADVNFDELLNNSKDSNKNEVVVFDLSTQSTIFKGDYWQAETQTMFHNTSKDKNSKAYLMRLKFINSLINETSGVLYNFVDDLINPSIGYNVELANTMKSFEFDGSDSSFEKIFFEYFGFHFVKDVIVSRPHSVFFEIFRRDNEVTFFLSELIFDREEAVRRGVDRNLSSIYDNKHKVDIKLIYP